MKKTLKSAASFAVLAMTVYTASAAVVPAEAHAGFIKAICHYFGDGENCFRREGGGIFF